MFVRLEVLNTFWTWYFQFTVGLWCKPCDKLRRICRVLDGWPVQFLLRKGKHAFFNGESPFWPKDFCQYVFLTYWQKSLGHVNVWQKPLQYCKVISLQLIKINEKKKPNQTNKQTKNLSALSDIFSVLLPASPSASLTTFAGFLYVTLLLFLPLSSLCAMLYTALSTGTLSGSIKIHILKV